MKKLLITGFNPFDERGYNTSSEVLDFLPEAIGGFVLVKKIIPVEWQEGQAVLWAHFEQEKPDAIFSMGMSKKDVLQFELIARNHRKEDLKDNCEQTPLTEFILEDAPKTYAVTWPKPEPLPQKLAAETLLEDSTDAGGYLCNQTFFLASAYGAQLNQTIPVAFVHIPPKAEDGGLDVDKTANGILELLKQSLKEI